MNRLEEDIKLQIWLQLEADQKSSVEKAQEENTRRLLNFLYGLIIWLVSFSILSFLRKSFQILFYVTLFAVDLLINFIGKYYNFVPEQLLKIRLTILYVLIIIILMIIA
ncbi:MAG: hypothetical protein Q7J16_08160 [Candidatus Cloacimonadales bacterium]|nr:hypothetical protein [Candidatus Cloacimonadales bacterium]